MAIEIYTPTFSVSKPLPFTPTTPELLALVERAIAAYPGETARILRGAEIVERDGVKVRADGVYEVGIFHKYPQVDGRCPCPDSALGHAPDHRCKHAYAKCLYRKLHAAPAPVRSKTFVASLDDTCGLVTVFEDGRASFTPHDATLAPWALSPYEIVYTLVLGNEVSA
jgi:hypothetical protein